MKTTRSALAVICACGMFALAAVQAQTQAYDLVIVNGRVIDPETGLDAVRNLGVSAGRIEIITQDEISGRERIDAEGLVVSPGFIDLHAHGQNLPSQSYQVRDGVTTGLELERGALFVAERLVAREGRALINYGYSAGYGAARLQVKAGDSQRAFHEPASEQELRKIAALVQDSIDQGAIGIGLPLDYMSRGISDGELEALFRIAAEHRMPLFIHIRMADDPADPSGFREIIDMSRKTGASAHMVHIPSTGLQRVPQYIRMLEKARADGLDITTELYPYTAGSTGITSGIFDHDWQRKFAVSYEAIEWPPTGKRFTGKAMWEEYRTKYPDDIVIIHIMKEEWVEAAMAHPGIMIASDSVMVDSLEQRAHPRGRGTFARVLGRYVREKGVLSLTDAISKMTYLPARRLESFTPTMRRKGRLQPGADADITIFNPDSVTDRATYAEPNQFSEGIPYVVVGGRIVVRDSVIQDDIFPGQPISTKGP